MTSFGHAAWKPGLRHGAALLLAFLGALPMEAALLLGPLAAALGALVFGWFCVRLSGVYLAMLTLAVAQILWATAFQWDDVTGGSNGLTGLWPAAWLEQRSRLLLPDAGAVRAGRLVAATARVRAAGYALRGVRDFGPARRAGHGRAACNGRASWLPRWPPAWPVRCTPFPAGSIAPDAMAVGRSVDGLVMVLLGGLQSLAGPLAGAAAYTWLQDAAARSTEYWHALLGWPSWPWSWRFPTGSRRGGALDPPAVASERREMSAPPCSRSATCASPSAASTRWPACRSRSRPDRCWP